MYTIVGRPDCHWCDKAKQLLKDNQVSYCYVDLYDNIWVAALMMKGGYKKVPLIIRQTEVIGGYTELEAYFKEPSNG